MSMTRREKAAHNLVLRFLEKNVMRRRWWYSRREVASMLAEIGNAILPASVEETKKP